MMKHLLVAALGILAGACVLAHQLGTGVLLAVSAVAIGRLRTHYNPLLEKQLDFLAVRLLQCLVVVTVLVSLSGAATTSFSVAYFGTALALSLMPLALPFVFRGKFAASMSKLHQHHAVMIIRSQLTACAAAASFVLISLITSLLFQLAPMLTLPQLLASLLLLSLPLGTVRHDTQHHKLIETSAANLHRHTLSWRAFQTYLRRGSLSALAALASYLLVFMLHGVNPRYVDPNLPLNHEATTAVFATLTCCALATILFERLDRHDKFFAPYLTHNKKLLQALCATLALLLAVVYLPGLSNLFQAAPLTPADWLPVLFTTALYATARLLGRHTRKHTRRAVLQLHLESEA